MGKRDLVNYLSGLPKKELETQLLDLYGRFPVVKEYYDFIFDPKEDKLIQEAKTKISNEYFPLRRKRPKARRSVAQKYIKRFIKLGMESHRIADLMLYNLEVAQTFESERNVPVAFYKSMLNSFDQVVQFVMERQLIGDFKARIVTIYKTVQENDWPHAEGFSRTLDLVD